MGAKVFDLEERTAQFGENIIEFCKSLEKNEINKELVCQLLKAGTSVGANYNEADGSITKRDFKHKISISRKESKESAFWLRMIAKANPERAAECAILRQEAKELTLIFSAILNKPKRARQDEGSI
ncbi:MAG: four helix bundle protein [Ignavibacteriales bacterium]|nr:four helix bundle protein [Ignavibacteriales bacterium]